MSARRKTIIAVIFITIIVVAITWWAQRDTLPNFSLATAVIITVTALLGVTSMLDAFSGATALFEATSQVEKAREKVEQQPEKAKPAWDLATAKLEAYLNLNIRQIRSIFYLSIGVMVVGFILIIVATSLALQSPNEITPAIVAGIGGVVTEFIGATFLLLYRTAIEHSGAYISTLDKTSSVGVAIQILDNISIDENDTESANKITQAKIDVAKL